MDRSFAKTKRKVDVVITLAVKMDIDTSIRTLKRLRKLTGEVRALVGDLLLFILGMIGAVNVVVLLLKVR